MAKTPDFFTQLSESIPWGSKEHLLWPVSTFVLRRNASRYLFPSKLQRRESLQLMEIFKQALNSLPEFQNAHFFKDDELSPAQKELFYEHFLFSQNFKEGPDGAAYLIDASTRVLARLNASDHLELYLIDPQSQFETSWNFLSRLDSALEKQLEWAYSSRFGYLTADPAYCGTGLSAYAHIHIPALMHLQQLPEILDTIEEDVEAVSLSGKLDELIGNIIILKNRYTLGVPEEKILHSVHISASKLTAAEKAKRQQLKEKQDPSLKDAISKAFGVLVHSYQLDAKELLNFLSLIKLGLDLGWIKGITDEKINELMFKCRRGHFSQVFPEISTQDLSHQRAEYLHQAFQGMELAI